MGLRRRVRRTTLSLMQTATKHPRKERARRMEKVTATMVHPRPPGPMGAEAARMLARNFRTRKRATIDPDRGSRRNRSVVAREKMLQSRGRQARRLPKAKKRK